MTIINKAGVKNPEQTAEYAVNYKNTRPSEVAKVIIDHGKIVVCFKWTISDVSGYAVCTDPDCRCAGSWNF